MLNEYELGFNADEETQNISRAKDESAVDCITLTRSFKKFCSGFKNLDGVGCPRGEMVKAMDCGIEFVFQSRYYVHFRANTLGKGL